MRGIWPIRDQRRRGSIDRGQGAQSARALPENAEAEPREREIYRRKIPQKQKNTKFAGREIYPVSLQ